MMVRIAVVDDDRLFLELVKEALQDRGWQTLLVWDAATACSVLREAQPDAVLLDIRMHADCGGWEILTLVLGDPRTAHIPIIVCSAAADELSAKRVWLESGGITVLPKPFDIDDLYERLEMAISRSATELADLPGA
jgi:two-component system OmpR family response regulator